MRNNKKGFTIVELVIVIAVIAILAAVLIPTFSSITQSAKEFAAQQQAKSGLNAVLALTGGSMPSGTIFAVNDDDDVTADYLFEYTNNKLQLKASGDEAVGKYEHTQKFNGNYTVYVSSKAIKELGAAGGVTLAANTVKMIRVALGLDEKTDAVTGDVALDGGKDFYVLTFKKTTAAVEEGQEPTVATVATVNVYYTTDIEDTMVILLGNDGAETPTDAPEVTPAG